MYLIIIDTSLGVMSYVDGCISLVFAFLLTFSAYIPLCLNINKIPKHSVLIIWK